MRISLGRMTVGDVDSAAAITLPAYGHPYGPIDIRRYLALQPDGWLMARIDGTPAGIGGITAYGNHAFAATLRNDGLLSPEDVDRVRSIRSVRSGIAPGDPRDLT